MKRENAIKLGRKAMARSRSVTLRALQSARGPRRLNVLHTFVVEMSDFLLSSLDRNFSLFSCFSSHSSSLPCMTDVPSSECKGFRLWAPFLALPTSK